MAMGTRKQREKQEGLWIAHTELASARGHLFLPEAELAAGSGPVRPACRVPLREVLCGPARSTVSDSVDPLPVAGGGLFRGQRSAGLPRCWRTRWRSAFSIPASKGRLPETLVLQALR
jgi:hypothetical protein